MKLLFGAVAYLAVVAAVVVAALAGLSSIERRQPEEPPVAAKPVDDPAARRVRAVEEVSVDPNRVPVWIAATAKYQYTPVPVDQKPKHTREIGRDARDAMAKAGNGNKPRHKARAVETVDQRGAAPALASSRRDNDPFFRD